LKRRSVAKRAPTDSGRNATLFNSLRLKGRIVGDIMSPVVPPETWEVLRETNAPVNANEEPQTRRRKRKPRRRG
jgi:hypothetical protein